MKGDACGAPVENGRCTYCGKVFPMQEEETTSKHHYERPTTVNVNINQNSVPNYTRPATAPKPKKKMGCGTIILIVLAVFVLIGIIGSLGNNSSSDNSNTAPESIWAQEDTPIDKFDYYLDGDYVYLKDYNGRDKKVKIGTSYEIEGKTYKVAPEIEGLFALSSVTSVILPEGITSMPSNTFNSSGIKYVYIPKSLQPGEDSYGFYGYFHDVEKVYYGGSEEEWAALTHNKARADIDVKEIVYNAKIEDLK